MKTKKRLLSILLSLALMLGMMPGMSITAYAADATTLATDTTTWENGDYVVPEGGVTISGHITVNGIVNLTLTEGATLTANMGITLSDGATINVSGEGAMVVKGSNGNTSSTVAGTGTLVLKSGTVTVTGGNGGDNRGVRVSSGAGGAAINGAVTVNGGTVTATGGRGGNLGERSAYSTTGAGGAAIGGSVTINAGTVTATGGNGGTIGERSMGAQTGAGGAGIDGSVTINGGKLTTTNGTGGGGQNDGTRGAGGKAVSGTVTCGEGVTQSGDTYEGPDISQGPDKTALNDAITAAETLYNSIKDNTDYADIAGTLKTAIDTAQGVYDNADADQDAVDGATTTITTAKTTAVVGMINKLPAASDVTTSDKVTIEAVRTAYASLSETEQGKVDANTLKKLTDAETALATAEVKAAIEALPAPADITAANKDDVQAAKAAYDALSDAQKEAVGNDAKAKLDACTTALAIAELPAASDVTATNKAAIEAARAAYDALTDAQKTAVGTDALAKLEACEVSLVNKMIEALPTATDVTTADKDDIEAARAAFTALTDAQKTEVGGEAKAKLEACEAALANIEVTNVQTLINNLPTATDVTTADKDTIEAARAAYDALPDAQKTAVGETARQKLEGVEVALVNKTIEALPEAVSVTTENKTAIEAARTKYNALNDTQKTQVGADAKAKLEAAEAALAIAELPAANAVTASDKAAIEAARTKYNALNDAQKAQVGDTAKAKLEADEVALLIAELPAVADVTTGNKADIEAAKAAYDALSADQKTQIGDTAKTKLEAAVVALAMKEVSAKTGSDITYTGGPLPLVNAPTTALPAGYTMKYAVTTENTAPTDDNLYTTSIPTATNAGTYYVWYKAVGTDGHADSAVACVTVTISEPSSGGGGGGYTIEPTTETAPSTPTETYTIPVENESSVNVQADIQNGNAKVTEITEEDIHKVTEGSSGEDSQGKTVDNNTILIDLSGATQKVKSVELSKTTMERLAETATSTENKIETVTVQLTNVTVELDAKTLSAVAQQAEGNSINLVVEDTNASTLNSDQQQALSEFTSASTFEAYFESAGSRIHDFKGGEATVSMKFTPAQGLSITHYHVYYVATSGKLERFVTRFIKTLIKAEKSDKKGASEGEGILQFTTTHFSDYAIVYDETMKNATGREEADDTSSREDKTKTANGKSSYENGLSINKGLKVSQKGETIQISWGKVKGADGYDVYVQYCGKAFSSKPVMSVNREVTSVTIKKINGKKLNLKKNYKIFVVAYKNVEGKKKRLAKSIVAHIVGAKNTRYSNPKELTITSGTDVTLGKGKTSKIKARVILANAKRKSLSDAYAPMFRYASSDKKIATVDKKGKITAKKQGSCLIWVYAKNGYAKKVKVTVK